MHALSGCTTALMTQDALQKVQKETDHPACRVVGAPPWGVVQGEAPTTNRLVGVYHPGWTMHAGHL
mgnify:CR=1 FL=1